MTLLKMADNNKNEALKGFTVTGLLGYLGYKNLDSVNFTSAKKTASSIMSASENKSEFRQVGETLKSNVDTLREVNKRSQQAALENLKSRFLDNIDDYLPRDGSALTNAEEARAFLSALFDSIREEDIVASGNQTEIDDIAIEKITIADTGHLSDSWFKTEILAGLNGTDIEFIDPSTNEGESGIVAVHLMTPSGVVRLD